MTHSSYNRLGNTSAQHRAKKVDWRSKILGSNIFSVLLVVLLILSFVKVSKEVLLRYEINQEINALQARQAELSDKTEDMNKLIAYLNTDEYIEKQARLQLNLSHPGEKQINLPGNNKEDLVLDIDNSTNIMKWFNYFFK